MLQGPRLPGLTHGLQSEPVPLTTDEFCRLNFTGTIRAGGGTRLCLSEGTFLHVWEVSLVNDNTSFTLIAGQELSAQL